MISASYLEEYGLEKAKEFNELEEIRKRKGMKSTFFRKFMCCFCRKEYQVTLFRLKQNLGL